MRVFLAIRRADRELHGSAGSSKSPPLRSGADFTVKKLLDAGAPAACSTAIVFGSSRLKMLIGVQFEIGASGVPQCTAPSKAMSTVLAAWIDDVEIRQARRRRRNADVAVVEADVPVPLLIVPDAERP